jgi:hypothetical protein
MAGPFQCTMPLRAGGSGEGDAHSKRTAGMEGWDFTCGQLQFFAQAPAA